MDAYRIHDGILAWTNELGYEFESEKDKSLFQKEVLELSKSQMGPLFLHLMKNVRGKDQIHQMLLEKKLDRLKMERESVNDSHVVVVEEKYLREGLELERTIGSLEQQLQQLKFQISKEEHIQNELIQTIKEIRQRRVYILSAVNTMQSIIADLETNVNAIKQLYKHEGTNEMIDSSSKAALQTVYADLTASLQSEITVSSFSFYR